MKTFQDLINAGIAPSRYDTPLMGQTTDTDPFVRTYNNIWGPVSDTHMSTLGDGRYVITGTMVADQVKFSSFLYSTRWGGYDFGSTSLKSLNDKYLSLSSLINRNNCIGAFGIINGDKVYIISHVEAQDKVICPCCTANCCIGCAESAMPISVSQITNNRKVLDSILTAEDNLLDKAKKLNESEFIDGAYWTVNYDHEGIRFVNENKKYILVK